MVVGSTIAVSGMNAVQRQQQMEMMVKNSIQRQEQGQWKMPLKKDIAIRDLAEPVINIIEWGKEFVGKALEPSPSGSLAWAGVCLLLPVCAPFESPMKIMAFKFENITSRETFDWLTQ